MERKTRARRVALHAVVALVACGQALCVLELVGVPLRPPEVADRAGVAAGLSGEPASSATELAALVPIKPAV